MEITVPGMSCAPCARAVTNAVHGVDPDASLSVDLETKRVVISTSMDTCDVVKAIEEAGYRVDA